jgi:hypothetical protein
VAALLHPLYPSQKHASVKYSDYINANYYDIVSVFELYFLVYSTVCGCVLLNYDTL